MLWIILIIWIVLFCILPKRFCKTTMIVNSCAMIMLATILFFGLKQSCIRKEIKQYATENQKIEELVETEAKVFLTAKNGPFTVDKNEDNAFEIIIAKYPKKYPDFTSIDLVKNQIENHTENVQKINELKIKAEKYSTFLKVFFFTDKIFSLG